jgi:hypothetical protein
LEKKEEAEAAPVQLKKKLTLFRKEKMFDSTEEINEEDTTETTVTVPSSLLEKSMVFCKIENTLYEDKIETLQEQLKYASVITEMKVNCLQRKYQRKFYDIVVMQLIKDKTKLWYNLIHSI